MVRKPNFIPNVIKRSISEIPVTISALSMGIFVTPIMTARVLRFIACMEIQAIVPIKVAISEDRRAIRSVLLRAARITSF